MNWRAEFGPDIKQILHIGKRKATAAMSGDFSGLVIHPSTVFFGTLAYRTIFYRKISRSPLFPPRVSRNLRYGTPEDGKLQLRSRPEAFPAPYFVDTGKFAASAARNLGYDIYYRAGPWLFDRILA